MYWENSPDVFCQTISDNMPRNRFAMLMKYFHLCDNNNLNADDKMCKLRPVKDMHHYVPLYPLLNILCPTLGGVTASNAWVLAQETGYVIQFDPYQGAKIGGKRVAPEMPWGLGEHVVVTLLEVLPKDVSYDNYFTSLRLMEHLVTNNRHIEQNQTVENAHY